MSESEALLGDREAVNAVKKLKVDRDAALARVTQLEKAVEALLADDDMPSHWDDCDCSFCAGYRNVRAALAVPPAEPAADHASLLERDRDAAKTECCPDLHLHRWAPEASKYGPCACGERPSFGAPQDGFPEGFVWSEGEGRPVYEVQDSDELRRRVDAARVALAEGRDAVVSYLVGDYASRVSGSKSSTAAPQTATEDDDVSAPTGTFPNVVGTYVLASVPGPPAATEEITEAFAALDRAERWVAEREDPDFAHAPAIATARGVLRDALSGRVAADTLTEALRAADDLLRRLDAWDVMHLPRSDGQYWRGEISRVRAALAAAGEEKP